MLLIISPLICAETSMHFLTRGLADTLYCSINGCSFEGDIDMNGYSIFNATWVNMTYLNATEICVGGTCIGNWSSVNVSGTNCSVLGSCSDVAYMGFGNVGDFNVSNNLNVDDDINVGADINLGDDESVFFGDDQDVNINFDSGNNRLIFNSPKVYSYVNTGLVDSNYLYDYTYRVTPVSDTATYSGILKNDLLLRGTHDNTGYHSAQTIGVYNTNSGTTSTLYGSRLVAYNNYKGTVTNMIAADYDARCRDYNGGGMVTNLYGAKYRTYATTKGSVGTGYGIKVDGGNIGTGSFGTYYGINIGASINAGGGTLTTAYGLYISEPVSAINNYGAYIGGNTIIKGNLNITKNIEVQGCIRYNCSGGCITLGTCI